MGKLTPTSQHGNKYLLFHCFRDHVTVKVTKTKDRATRTQMDWMLFIERLHGRDGIRTLRTDIGSEFANTMVDKFLAERGIARELT